MTQMYKANCHPAIAEQLGAEKTEGGFLVSENQLDARGWKRECDTESGASIFPTKFEPEGELGDWNSSRIFVSLKELASKLLLPVSLVATHDMAADECIHKEGVNIYNFAWFGESERSITGQLHSYYEFALLSGQSDYHGCEKKDCDAMSEGVAVKKIGENKYVVAVLFDLSHCVNYKLLDAVLEDICSLIATGKPRKSPKLKSSSVKELWSHTKKYIKANQTRVRGEIVDDMRHHEDQIQSLTKEINDEVARVREIDLILVGLEKNGIPAEVQIAYKALLKDSRVDFVTVSNCRMSVYTKCIYVCYDGKEYELGKYIVEINLGSFNIKIINRTRIVEGKPHPHASRDGIPCLGNIGSLVSNLKLDSNLPQIALLMLEWLQSENVTGDTWGYYLLKYPVKRRRKRSGEDTTKVVSGEAGTP